MQHPHHVLHHRPLSSVFVVVFSSVTFVGAAACSQSAFCVACMVLACRLVWYAARVWFCGFCGVSGCGGVGERSVLESAARGLRGDSSSGVAVFVVVLEVFL